jgi:APA family basic amino acid/polyamine antiporter
VRPSGKPRALSRSGKRVGALGIWTALALVVGNMVGSGAYLLPASLGRYGPISLLGWLLTAAGALSLALVFARLGRIMPVTGGPYMYTRVAMGDAPAFLVAWGYWVSVWVANAGIATAFVAYLTPFFPVLKESPVCAGVAALGTIWVLTAVNLRGVREAGILQLVTTVLKVLPLILVGTLGLLALNTANLTPFNPGGGSGISAVTASATLTLWAFLGLECATIPAEQVRDPERTIPLATVGGTVVTAAIYLLSSVAVMGVLSAPELSASSAPFAEAAARMWGPAAGKVVAAGAALAAFGVLNGWVLVQGQMPLAPGRDGLFPAAFARLSRRDTPAFGLVLSSILATVLVAANYTRGLVGLFTFTALLGTVTALLAYVGSSLGQILLIFREPARFGGRGARRAVVISAVAFVYSVWAIIGAGWDVMLWGGVLLAAGIPVYLVGAPRRAAAAAASEVADA